LSLKRSDDASGPRTTVRGLCVWWLCQRRCAAIVASEANRCLSLSIARADGRLAESFRGERRPPLAFVNLLRADRHGSLLRIGPSRRGARPFPPSTRVLETMSTAKSTADVTPFLGQRLVSLDQFRGYTVAGMFLVNFLGRFNECPEI